MQGPAGLGSERARAGGSLFEGAPRDVPSLKSSPGMV